MGHSSALELLQQPLKDSITQRQNWCRFPSFASCDVELEPLEWMKTLRSATTVTEFQENAHGILRLHHHCRARPASGSEEEGNATEARTRSHMFEWRDPMWAEHALQVDSALVALTVALSISWLTQRSWIPPESLTASKLWAMVNMRGHWYCPRAAKICITTPRHAVQEGKPQRRYLSGCS